MATRRSPIISPEQANFPPERLARRTTNRDGALSLPKNHLRSIPDSPTGQRSPPELPRGKPSMSVLAPPVSSPAKPSLRLLSRSRTTSQGRSGCREGLLRGCSSFDEVDEGLDGLPWLAHKKAQKGPEGGQDLPHVVPNAEEDGVPRVSNHVVGALRRGTTLADDLCRSSLIGIPGFQIPGLPLQAPASVFSPIPEHPRLRLYKLSP